MKSFAVILMMTIAVCHGAKLPSDWGRCHKSDPNFKKCMAKNVEYAIHSLKKGSDQLKLSSFDPLFIPELHIGEGKGPVNVAQNFKNVRLHGLTDSKVLFSDVDFENKIHYARSITPELRLEAEYSMKGRILLLPIIGEGPCNVTLVNTRINHTLYAEDYTKKGQTYRRFKEYVVTLRPEKVIFKFDNLFNGDQILGENINKVLNENDAEVFADVREGYEKSFGAIFHSLANQVFTKVPFNDIILE